MIRQRFLCVASMLAVLLPATARAQDAGTNDYPWLVKLGVHDVDPKSNNGSLAGGAIAADVDSSVRPTVSIEYLFTPHIGIEALAAWPFEHEIKLNGVRSANTKQLPPTFSLQYHFLPGSVLSPYIGVGVNYTRFFHIHETGLLSGDHLDLGSSWGVAAHAGLDYRLNDRWLVGVDVRWIDLDTRVKVNGARLGMVTISPWVYGAYVGFRF